jgi:hypothetical protein
MDDKSREFLAATGGDAREAQTQPPKTEERAAFEAWYANRHPKPVHENATWAHASKVDDWEVWQARAALSSRPVQGGETPSALLVRDVAEMAGVSVPDICTAVRAIGHRETSTNTAIHPMVAVCAVAYLRKEGQFSALSSAPAQPVREPMSEGRASDRQLMDFYSVDTLPDLIDAQACHIERLQAKLPQLDQPAFTRVREG